MNWDRMNRNAARTGSFVGQGPADEDAYFTAFASDDKALVVATAISALRGVMKQLPIATNRAAVVK